MRILSMKSRGLFGLSNTKGELNDSEGETMGWDKTIRVVRFAATFEFRTGDEICGTLSLENLKSEKSRILDEI